MQTQYHKTDQITTIAVLGSTGQTGRLIVKYAVQSGLKVRALIRNPAKFPFSHAGLQVVQGDATHYDSITELINGAHTVVSALGPRDRATGFKVCSSAASLLAESMPKAGISRYVAISGASLAAPTDKFSLRGKFFRVAALVLTRTSHDLKALLTDKQSEYETLKESSLLWTLVRPPYIVPGEYLLPPVITPHTLPGSTVRVAELAQAIINLALSEQYPRQAVFISSRKPTEV